MIISNGASYPFAGRTQNTNAAARTDAASPFAAMLEGKTQDARSATSGTAGMKQVDFTNMTRQEMRDWVNQEIQNGNMTLDESTPFMLMTMKTPVGGGFEIPAADDNERIDFTNRSRMGIEGAFSRNDFEAAKRLQAALDIMMKVMPR